MDGLKCTMSEFDAGRPNGQPIIVIKVYKPNAKRYLSMTKEERAMAYEWFGDRIQRLKRLQNDFAKDAGKRKRVPAKKTKI